MKKIFFFLFVLVIVITGSPLFAQKPQDTEIVSVLRTEAHFRALSRLGLDLVADWGGRIYIAAPPSDLRKIENLGLPIRIETWTLNPKVSVSTGAADNPIGAYHTHRELETDLLALQARFPQQAKVYKIGLSLENRPIYALKVSDHPEIEEGKPAVLFLGCHHAREWISVEVPFLLGKHLLENYASDPEIKRFVDTSEIWIVPLVNPDGHNYSVQVYRYWRKNRRMNGDSQFGVDLNRNFGYAWGYDNTGSSPNPGSEVYRGPVAFSEPETRAVRDLILNRNFGALISYHSFSQLIMYPWGYTQLPTDQDVLMKDLGSRMSALIQDVNGRTYESAQSGQALYLTNGDTTDWAFAATGMPAYTIELPPVDEMGGGFFNREEDIAPIFRENLPAMLHLIDWTIAHPNPIPESPYDLRSFFRSPKFSPRNPEGRNREKMR